MTSRYRAHLVVKLFPSVPKGAFGNNRLTDWLEKNVFYREFHVSPWKAGVAAALAGAAALWAFGALGLSLAAVWRAELMRREVAVREAELREARERHEAARRDYVLLLSTLHPLNERVDALSELAARLGTVAGVEGLADRIAAPAEERRTNLRLTSEEVAELDRRFDRLGSFLATQEIELSHTPSISPVAKDFVVTDRFGFRSSRFTRMAGVGGADREFHAGLDLACVVGTPIRASADGTVHFSGRVPAKQNPRAAFYGNFVVLDHGNGIRSIYAHCDQLAAVTGESVRRGDVIAWVGSTGRSTGPHLHYEVVVGGRPVDPELFILDVPMPLRRVQVAFDDRSILSDEVDRLLGR